MSKGLIFALLFSLGFITSLSLQAQTTQASISGKVTDNEKKTAGWRHRFGAE